MVIDQFSGARGWEAACPEVDALGIEIDTYACATSRAAGFQGACADIAALDPGAFRDVDGLIGSPPCQGFSAAGKGGGRKDTDVILRCAHEIAAGNDTRTERLAECRDARSLLVLEPLRWALALKPRWVALEQVPPVLGLWSEFAQILSVFGYSTAVGVLRAEQYGVPQTRKRAFLVARLDGEARLPEPTHQRYVAPRGRQGRQIHPDDHGLKPWVSMAEALGWPDGTQVISNYGTGGDAAKRGRRMATEPSAAVTSKIDRNVVLRQGAADRQWVLRGNNSVAGGPLAERGLGEPALTLGSRVDRWVFDRPATSVNADPRISAPGRDDPGVSGSQQEGAIRVTPEEAAALQGFPAGFPFQGPKTRVFQQIGNAVPPPLGAAVLAEVMK